MDRPSITLNPAKTYVLLRAPAQIPLVIVREPTEADRAAWRTRRTGAFAQVQRRYTQKMARYERNRSQFERADAQTRRSLGIDEVPVAPVEENFAFAPPDFENIVSIGPSDRFSKVGESVYLTELPVGTYTIFGMFALSTSGGMTGTCFCMGTLKFAVAAGAITDLGTWQFIAGTSEDPTITNGHTIVPYAVDMSVDPRIASFPRKAAEYHAVGHLPNVRGVMIDRLRPIDGLLRYDRDRVIDVKTGEEAARWMPPAASQ